MQVFKHARVPLFTRTVGEHTALQYLGLELAGHQHRRGGDEAIDHDDAPLGGGTCAALRVTAVGRGADGAPIGAVVVWPARAVILVIDGTLTEIPVGSLEEAIEVGNSVDYGLSASIYTQDVNRAFTAMREMYTGIFYVNAPTIGAEVHLPFGGTKATGNGHREAGTAALDVFSEWKSIYVDFSGRLQRAQIDTQDL